MTTAAPTVQLVDSLAAAVAAEVHPETIRSWLKRAKLTRHGKDDQGRTLVDLAEVYQCVAATPAAQLAGLLENVEFLLDTGEHTSQIPARVGKSREAIEVALRRHHPDLLARLVARRAAERVQQD